MSWGDKLLKPMPALHEVTEEFVVQGMVIRAGETVMLVLTALATTGCS